MNLVIFSLVSAIISFIVAIIYSYIVRRKDAGTDEMVSISLYIREGARAFLKREWPGAPAAGLRPGKRQKLPIFSP